MADEPAAEPATAARPDAVQLRALVEALLFVSDGPVAVGALARALDVTPRRIEISLDALEGSLEEHGVQLQRGPEGVQLITAPEAAEVVQRFLGLESARRLSTAALETLAVIAYRQPVTRAAIEAIRGTSSDAVIATLRARGLIERVGRASGPGRPALYGTTQRFLEHFGLRRSSELPGIDEFAERLGVAPPSDQPSLLDARAEADGEPAGDEDEAPENADARAEADGEPAGDEDEAPGDAAARSEFDLPPPAEPGPPPDTAREPDEPGEAGAADPTSPRQPSLGL